MTDNFWREKKDIGVETPKVQSESHLKKDYSKQYSSIDSTSSVSTDYSKLDDLNYLKSHPLIVEYASINGQIYDLIKATNPTLVLFVDLAKKIVGCDLK